MLVRKTRDSPKMSDWWQRISFLRKVTLIIVLIMWIAISIGIGLSWTSELWQYVVALCLLWLGFVVVAYFVTTFDFSQYGY